MSNPTPTQAPAGFYDDGTGSGRQRWFNGTEWTDQYQAAPVQQQVHYSAPVQTDARKARDKAVYTRQQKGHSLVLHLLLGAFVLWIPAIYISVSPNHYWHA